MFAALGILQIGEDCICEIGASEAFAQPVTPFHLQIFNIPFFCRSAKKRTDDDRGERRRETSRFAARDRRGQETEVFALLKAVVPVVDEPTFTHVDRIAQLRLATTYCRLRDIVPQFKLHLKHLWTLSPAGWLSG